MALNAYLKIDGIDGESRAEKHKDEIEIESFSWGESNFVSAGSGGGGGAGKVTMNDFHFVMSVSKASPKLFLACATGEHLPEAVLSIGKSGGDGRQIDYLYWKLSDCLVCSYQAGGSSGDPVPSDSFSLNFKKIEISYKQQNADGSPGSEIRAGWDLAVSKKI